MIFYLGALLASFLDTEKPELHEVPGHSCNSGAQRSPKTTPWEPLGDPSGDPPGEAGRQATTEKPELHEVPGHLCNSGAQKSPKTTPREPPGNSTPEAHEPAK